MTFEPRFTKPEAGNKYYITIVNGGWSRAIMGKPRDPDCDTLANCVGYAFGRFHEIAGCQAMNLFDPVNAENIFENAQRHGLKTGSTPQLGALIVWQKGDTLSSKDGAGHVAVVEEIGIGGEIRTSESGYGAAKPFWCGDYKQPYAYKDGYRLLGFVYQPMSGRALRKGDKGAEVELMQSRLCERGYLRKTEIDGSFGRITLGAVLCFQFEHGLDVDGVCGPKTQAALTSL
jgi:surface antigen